MLHIEKGVPIAAPAHAVHLQGIPWEKMEGGDSVVVPVKNPELTRIVQSSLTQAARYRGFRVKTRRTTGGVRMWMVGPIPAAAE